MQTYDGNVEVITNIGTTVDERGLTTEQFKAKFDEGLKAFVEWFNTEHKTEIDHLAVLSGTDYTTKRVRNIRFKATNDFTSGELATGEIGFVYTP